MTDTKLLKELLEQATEFAHISSDDPHTKVGCVLYRDGYTVVSSNEFPYKMEYPGCRQERPQKYMWVAHAEESCVSRAAKYMYYTDECIAVITHMPCARCTRMLLLAGVKEIYWGDGKTVSNNDTEYEISLIMMKESGIKYGQI